MENVRYILNTTTKKAKRICEFAVKEGAFNKSYGVKCENYDCGVIIKSFKNTPTIIDIKCSHCLNNEEEYGIKNSTNTSLIEFYELAT